jgi:cell division protein FtsA
VVGLDIGTTRVRAIIAERNEENGHLEVTGIGDVPSTGLKNGKVSSIDATLHSVAQAVEAAEIKSGQEVSSCWLGIGGDHIKSYNSSGNVAITRKGHETREIGTEDLDRVIESASAIVIPLDRQVLQVIPQSYTVDKQKGIKNPLDMLGVRLEADVHIITCSITSAQTLIKCVNRAGFRVNDMILQTLAAGKAVLTDYEKEAGVVLVDLGGGSTEMMIYTQGAPFSTATIPIGGSKVTDDISIIKGISFDTAEELKKSAGCCWDELLEEDEAIDVPGIGNRPPTRIPRSHLVQIIRPRMEEIFALIQENLASLRFSRPLGGGIVLTGGGAQMQGVIELAQSVFNMPVRSGEPRSMGGLESEYRRPEFAVAAGLVLEGNEREQGIALEPGFSPKKRETSRPSPLSRFTSWVKSEFF